MDIRNGCNKKKIKYLLITVVIIAFLYVIFLGIKNRRYTENLSDFPLIYVNDELNYYQEQSENIKIEIIRLYSLLCPESAVRMTLQNVYWKEKDTYIDISLTVKETLLGEYAYGISYISELEQYKFPINIGNEEIYYSGKINLYDGWFEVDENMNSLYTMDFEDDSESEEYKNFLIQNRESLKYLVTKANDYWNLGLNYQLN